MNLDRFSQGLPDPQDTEVHSLTKCSNCGEEIYPDDDVYLVARQIYCTECNAVCLMPVEEALEQGGQGEAS
jgi:DNA-directed RNA polymerase subunit RPC12/RpoP